MRMRYEYKDESAGQSEHEEISTLLQHKIERRKDVTLLNYFMEMPIVSKSHLEAADKGAFVFSPSETHIKVISEKMKTILKFRSGHSVLANCLGVSLRNKEVILTGFRYISLHSENRESLRVRLTSPINVSLVTEVGKLAGILKDISISGCKIALFARILTPGDTIILALKMFDTTTQSVLDIAIPAVLVRTDNVKIPVVCGFRFELDSAIEEKLILFINQRQMELIKELKESLL